MGIFFLAIFLITIILLRHLNNKYTIKENEFSLKLFHHFRLTESMPLSNCFMDLNCKLCYELHKTSPGFLFFVMCFLEVTPRQRKVKCELFSFSAAHRDASQLNRVPPSTLEELQSELRSICALDDSLFPLLLKIIQYVVPDKIQ